MYLVTEKGRNKIKHGEDYLLPGDVAPAEKWPTRNRLVSRGWLRQVTQEEYDGALALREAQQQPTTPFADFSDAVQKSLAEAGIKTVKDVKVKTETELVALDGIGEATAKKLLALEG